MIVLCSVALFSKRKRYDSLFMDDKKGGFASLFLSLSFTHFTMIYKNALLYPQSKWEQLPHIIVR
jgi:hypothetical protein